MHKMLGVTVIKIKIFIASANCWAQLQIEYKFIKERTREESKKGTKRACKLVHANRPLPCNTASPAPQRFSLRTSPFDRFDWILILYQSKQHSRTWWLQQKVIKPCKIWVVRKKWRTFGRVPLKCNGTLCPLRTVSYKKKQQKKNR